MSPLLLKLAFKYRDIFWALSLMLALGLIQREHDAKVECQALINAKPLVSAAVVVDVKKGPSRVKETERRFKRPAPPAPLKTVTTAELARGVADCPEVDVIEIERDIYTGPEESHSSNTHTETPRPLPPIGASGYKRYYMGVSLPAASYREVAPRAGVTLLDGMLDLGVAFDPWVDGHVEFNRRALRLETAFRF